MGTINYKTSDYITLGVQPLDSDNYLDEDGNIDYEFMDIDYRFLWDTIQTILDKYNFYYYHVTIESGYYEGFSINIECNFPVCFNDYIDKKEAQKEITQLKYFLFECVENGLVKCSPGWCTAYYTPEETIQEIKKAIAEIRKEAKNIPTYFNYNME